MAHPFPASVYKAYDIRGSVPDQLDPVFARALGRALAASARAQGIGALVV
ncbi:phosphomannomutase/phosphoglucomutase, partial [Bordetella pertussis]